MVCVMAILFSVVSLILSVAALRVPNPPRAKPMLEDMLATVADDLADRVEQAESVDSAIADLRGTAQALRESAETFRSIIRSID